VKVEDEAAFEPLNLKGNIQFNDVYFAYPGRPDIEVLKKIQFNIKQGQRIALVGSSGAGKSTIVSLLMRFYQTNSGYITVDQTNIDDFNLTAFRKNIAIVPQEILLFGGTIKENILYGKPNASESEILEAARKSNAIEFIETFPEGFNTVVGERGIKLSGGQRQRIAIARAILRNPSILILDEATSSLDAESERTVQTALDNLMYNRTSIIIAHRLSTIRKVDCIYVLKSGEIAESGTHDELIQKEKGIYKHLINLQLNDE